MTTGVARRRAEGGAGSGERRRGGAMGGGARALRKQRLIGFAALVRLGEPFRLERGLGLFFELFELIQHRGAQR